MEQPARRRLDACALHRALGLLWPDQGEHPVAVAQRLGVTREAVYSWARRLKREGPQATAQSLRDRPSSGRPKHQRQAMEDLVRQKTHTSPSRYTYMAEGRPPP